MKVESGTMPQSFKITKIGNEAIIEFAENVEERLFEKAIVFVYDSYALKTKFTPTLERRVAERYDLWMKKAKNGETASVEPTENDLLKTKIMALEARLTKVEAVPIVKTALEPVVKDPILTR